MSEAGVRGWCGGGGASAACPSWGWGELARARLLVPALGCIKVVSSPSPGRLRVPASPLLLPSTSLCSWGHGWECGSLLSPRLVEMAASCGGRSRREQ